jgi:hypothetical protein
LAAAFTSKSKEPHMSANERTDLLMRNFDAMGRCGTALTRAMQAAVQTWFEFGQLHWQRNLETLNKVALARNVEEFVQIQKEFARACMPIAGEDRPKAAPLESFRLEAEGNASGRGQAEKSRYFFHVVDDDGREHDDHGAELATDHLARIRAFQAAHALLWCGDPEGRCARNWRIEVTDEAGQVRFEFPVAHAHEPAWLTL